MDQHEHDYDEHDAASDTPIEAYCVRCRQSVEVEAPTAVWTRKGMPATRGDCPICGGTVFRMGATDAHRASQRPSAVAVDDGQRRRRQPVLAKGTVYVNFAAPDEALAAQVAADLNNAGVAAWLHEVDEVQWAGGVHPALTECQRMVFVLSAAALADEQVTAAWQFFRDKRKPIVIAQAGEAAPPDPIRRSPRYDLAADYKGGFRALLRALTE